MGWLAFVVMCVAACGRVDFDTATHTSDAAPMVDAGISPIHRYRFAGNLDDDFGGPSLTASGTTAFTANGASFTMRSGFTVDGATPQGVYTIETILQFDDLSDWRKVIDFDHYTKDTGFYGYKDAIQQVIVPSVDFLTAPATLADATMFRATLVRDSNGLVTAYLDGTLLTGNRASSPEPPTAGALATFAFDDSAIQSAMFSSTFASWFVDDTPTNGNESSSGTVRQITIWDVPLDAEQVAANH
ncbi:MAG: hypothetical protein QM831_38270 [Kofleriaceae bacterium]